MNQIQIEKEDDKSASIEETPLFKKQPLKKKLATIIGRCYIDIGTTLLDADEDEVSIPDLMALQLGRIDLKPEAAPQTDQKPKIITLPRNSIRNMGDEDSESSVEGPDVQESEEKVFLDFSYLFEENQEGLDDALDMLNFEASKIGYKFKRGPFSESDDNSYFSIYCKYKPRNKKKNLDKDQSGEGKSLQTKKIQCPSYYRFKFDPKKKIYFLNTKDQHHTHQAVDEQNLSSQMREELQFFKKKRYINDILRYFEAKFKCSLSYNKLYYEYRKLKPLFGEKDCQNFLNFLESSGAFEAHIIDKENENLTRLLFCTQTMMSNYEKYGDLILLDSTYNTNLYRIPLVVISGIAVDGTNVVFGAALTNQENSETYIWILKNFFEANKSRLPHLIVTDGDLAILKALKEFPEIVHLLCQWHVKRNLNRNFKYLKENNPDYLSKVISLPDIKKPEDFDKCVQSLVEFFGTKATYAKSANYLDSLVQTKEKWTDSYRPRIFTGGCHTTSRIEGTNAIIKKYLSKTTELSAMIELIEDFQKQAFLAPKIEKKVNEQERILESLRDKIGLTIYKKHVNQFHEHSHYSMRAFDKEEGAKEYKVFRDTLPQELIEASTKTVLWRENKITCSCPDYFVEGIICRHLFAVAKVRLVKDMSQFIHERWNLSKVGAKEFDEFPRERKAKLLELEIKEENEEEEIEESVLSFSKTMGLKQKKKVTPAKNKGKTVPQKGKKDEKSVQNFPKKPARGGKNKDRAPAGERVEQTKLKKTKISNEEEKEFEIEEEK